MAVEAIKGKNQASDFSSFLEMKPELNLQQFLSRDVTTNCWTKTQNFKNFKEERKLFKYNL